MVKRLLLLNGLATIGVVLNHAAGWGFIALFNWTDRYMAVSVPNYDQLGSVGYYGVRTIEQFVAASVAAFLVVSGFFIAFAARRHAKVGWYVVQSRIKYLLIPYLIWSAGIFLLEFLEGTELSLYEVGFRLLTGNVTDGYYYVPMMIQLFLLAPFLVRLAHWNFRLTLLLAGIIQLLVQSTLYLTIAGVDLPTWFTFWSKAWLFPSNLFWFTLGIVIGFNLKSFKAWLVRYRWVWLVLAVVMIPVGIIEWEYLQSLVSAEFLPTRFTAVDNLCAIGMIFTILAFDRVNPPDSIPLGELGTKSFGVYLANSPVLALTARVVASLIPAILAYQIIFQPILWVAGLSIPLLLMTAVAHPKSPIRSYYQYIFG